LVKSDENGGNVFIAGTGDTWKPKPKAAPKPQPIINWTSAQNRFLSDLTDDLEVELAHHIGVGQPWTMLFGIGWSAAHQAWTFPMRDHMSRIVGIRLRTREGRKLAIKGSKEGIFSPEIKGMTTEEVLIGEGPTDAMHLWRLGFIAIGRPSCTGAADICQRFLGNRSAVIVSDRDSPGRKGAASLADKLSGQCDSVKVIEPLQGKDARDWIEAGATAEQIRIVIDSAMEYGDETKQVSGGTA
tara:strand:- start:556 stop:1281 length:726 start_codon:yes stop_codon:yes gene_type:complete